MAAALPGFGSNCAYACFNTDMPEGMIPAWFIGTLTACGISRYGPLGSFGLQVIAHWEGAHGSTSTSDTPGAAGGAPLRPSRTKQHRSQQASGRTWRPRKPFIEPFISHHKQASNSTQGSAPSGPPKVPGLPTLQIRRSPTKTVRLVPPFQ